MSNNYKIGEYAERPWGTWRIDSVGNESVKKIITVNAGECLSLQSHEYRKEEWEVIEGIAEVVLDSKIYTLSRGGKISIPQRMKHRLKNIGDSVLIVAERQIGKILDENDIIRYEDKYGRADFYKKKYYIVSGGFDPIHEGHIAMIREAAKRSDGVILLLNSDNWLRRKKGKSFMEFNSRKIVCENIKGIIRVYGFNDEDGTACAGIKLVREQYPDVDLIFANGGDRDFDNVPEVAVCNQYNVYMEFGIGGNFKANSSSWILKNWGK